MCHYIEAAELEEGADVDDGADGGGDASGTPSSTVLSGAFHASDTEAVEMSRMVAALDGLFIGSSSAVNLVRAPPGGAGIIIIAL